MGADKAVVPLAGRPLAAWVADVLRGVCDDVVVAGRPEGLAGLPGVADQGERFAGPLAGLVAALGTARPGLVAIVGVDQPWVRAETLRRLAGRVGEIPIVPVDDGVRQATCAVYPTSVLEVAADELAGGGSLQSLLDRCAFDPVTDWRSWGEDGRSWYSVDTLEDLETGLIRFGAPSG